MQTSEVLNKAADLIEERGWTFAGGWHTGNDLAPLCLEGGIQAAMGKLDEDFAAETDFIACPAYQAVHRYLEMTDRDLLYDFNDALDRTATEVIEVLRACAVIEASREAAEVSA